MEINNLNLFNVSTIRLNKQNQDGIIYLVDIVYQLRAFVKQYDNQEHDEMAYELCVAFVKNKERIQAARLECKTLSEHLLNINKLYPRWKTRKSKMAKRDRMYWKRLYTRKLSLQKARLEAHLRKFEQDFSSYSNLFNHLYERVKNVCLSK